MISNASDFHRKASQAVCRCCGNQGLTPVLDLGSMPLSDGFISASQLTLSDARFPLELAFCPDCSLVQILETVPPEVLFAQDYPYYSSYSDSLLEHSRRNVQELIQRHQLGPRSFVIEIASNDGYLLRNFVEADIPVLGIDPASGPASQAVQAGVPTLCEFFTLELARKLKDQGRQADVIIANNVLAHVADTQGLVQGIGTLLKDNGVAVIECPYVRDLIDHCEFDTIYHEHLCYFSVTSLSRLFRRQGLFLNHVVRLPIHGGSLRLFVGRYEDVQESVLDMLEDEAQAGVDRIEYYLSFAQRVEEIRDTLRSLLLGLSSTGNTIAAYGAPAKGTILLNYIGVGADVVRFAVDRNVHKQGKFIPGVRIPISEPNRILAEQPDYVLLLPWNLREEILLQQQDYRKQGGCFIVPIPQPQFV